jgi:hypothetical protein
MEGNSNFSKASIYQFEFWSSRELGFMWKNSKDLKVLRNTISHHNWGNYSISLMSVSKLPSILLFLADVYESFFVVWYMTCSIASSGDLQKAGSQVPPETSWIGTFILKGPLGGFTHSESHEAMLWANFMVIHTQCYGFNIQSSSQVCISGA